MDIEKGVISKKLIQKSKVILYEKCNDNDVKEFCCICRDNF